MEKEKQQRFTPVDIKGRVLDMKYTDLVCAGAGGSDVVFCLFCPAGQKKISKFLTPAGKKIQKKQKIV